MQPPEYARCGTNAGEDVRDVLCAHLHGAADCSTWSADVASPLLRSWFTSALTLDTEVASLVAIPLLAGGRFPVFDARLGTVAIRSGGKAQASTRRCRCCFC